MPSGGRLALAVAGAWLVQAVEARAQDLRPPIAVEGTIGWVGFADEATIQHAVYGGAVRIPLTPRLSLGPEVVYMIGPGSDRDVVGLCTLWFDFFRPRPGFRVVPFLVASGGLMHHRSEFYGTVFDRYENATYGGGGVRVHFNDRVYAGVDMRIGWAPQLRLAGTFGVQLR